MSMHPQTRGRYTHAIICLCLTPSPWPQIRDTAIHLQLLRRQTCAMAAASAFAGYNNEHFGNTQIYTAWVRKPKE